MRIRDGDRPIVERGASFRIEVDGVSILAYEGETVASAILAHGLRILRRTRLKDSPRGLFCGTGVCYDCLVVIDGTPNLRACMTPATPGLRVQTQKGMGPAEREGRGTG
ncbi:MAG: (2Fe-2S)-binding protein [Dehalococcoidia bacterium]